MTRSLNIDNEIVRQVKALDPLAFFYIGTKSKMAVEVNGMIGLRLVCTKGIYVDVLLNEGEDLYEVYSWKAGRGKNLGNRNIKSTATGVFVDSMPKAVCDAYDTALRGN